MSIYESSVKKPISTALIYVAIAILGLFSLTRLAIELMPDSDTTTISVITAYPGASAEDIEMNLSKPLENSLNSVSNLKHITSKSRENISLISLEFNAGTPVESATNDVRDKLDAITNRLPSGIQKPVLFKFGNSDIPVAILSVESKESASALSKILEDKVTNPLARVDGVGSVTVSGAQKRVVQIYCDPSKLEAYNLTIGQIGQLIAAENANIPAGQIDLGTRTNSIRVQGEFTDTKQLENIVVRSTGGSDVFLKDVAVVKDTVAERQQENYTNGSRGAIVVINKQEGANSVEISKQIKALLPQIQSSLPSDVKLSYLIDTSNLILNSINSLEETIIITFVIVMLVVFIFLGQWKATFIIILTIPISLVASFAYLLVTGNSLNIISLSSLSIAIGMVVDDAIVVLENITSHIERGSYPKQAAVHATNEVGISVIASTLTMLAVFLPLTMLPGASGIMFRQLGWSISVVMIVSTAAALSLTPMLCSQLLKRNPSRSKLMSRLFAPIESALDKLDVVYVKTLGWAVRNRKTTIFGALGIFGVSLLGLGLIKTEYMASQDNGFITMNVQLPVGTRVEEARAVGLRLQDQVLKEIPAVRTVSTSVGQADTDNSWASMSENGSNIVTYRFGLHNRSDRDLTQDQVSEEIRKIAATYPEISSYEMVSGGATQSTNNVNIEIYGHDFQTTDAYAKKIRDQLLAGSVTSLASLSRKDYTPELRFIFDRQKLAENGLNLSTAAAYLRNAVNGSVVSKFREDGDEYDIRVSASPESRQSLQDLTSIMVYNSQGKGIRLSELGELKESFTPPTIERKDRSRLITITATPKPEFTLSDLVKDVQQAISDNPLPDGVTYKLAGAYESQQESFGDMMTLMALIVILVFIVMAAQFESLVDPFVIMFSIPFAFTGVFVGLIITQIPMGMMAMVGLIMLIGIVVKNGIVLIDYIRLCRERGLGVRHAILTSGKSRLRPVLMTTLTTVLGMLPMALGIGEGSEMWQSMGVTVFWGLSFSTLVTLILIPTLYTSLEARRIKRARKAQSAKMARKLGKKSQLVGTTN